MDEWSNTGATLSDKSARQEFGLSQPMSKSGQPFTTISQALDEFLGDQKSRVSPKTFSKYQNVIGLYKAYLESYWPGHDGQYAAITKKGGTYCGTYGPQDAAEGYGEFLGYFIPRKVLCGKETMLAACTVTKNLAKWLSQKGYIKDTKMAQERAKEAAQDLRNDWGLE